MPNDPVAAVDLLANGHRGRATSARSGSDASTGGSSASTPASATTPPSSAGRAARVDEALVGHPLFISAALTHLGERLRPAPAALLARLPATEHRLDDGYFSIVLNTNPYTYLGNRPLDLSPAATLDRGSGRRHVPHDAGRGHRQGARPARCAAAACGRASTSSSGRDLDRARRLARRAVPVPGRRRLPRRDHPARVRPRAGRGAAGVPR